MAKFFFKKIKRGIPNPPSQAISENFSQIGQKKWLRTLMGINQNFILQIFSFMIKGFLLIASLKTNINKWRIQFCFLSVQFISTECCTPQRLSPLCVAHHGDRLCVVYRDHLRGMLHTVEMISAVCCTPRRWSLRYFGYFAHLEDHLRGRMHTAEITLWSNISAKSKPNTKIL